MLFVGRARELALLRGALETALGGAGCLVLLLGEAGIGKTRLLEQVAREAESRGARTLFGRCHEGEGAPAYWPWVMALRELASSAERERPNRLASWLGTGASAIAQVIPELVPDAAVAASAAGVREPALDPESARFRFFDAVASLLARAAAEQPLVVLLDDLHWADGGSLRLLLFVARQITRSHVLLVGTLRDVELRAAAEPTLRAELARAGEEIALEGLDAAEVGDVLRGLLEAEPRAGLAEKIHDVTGGNPFFVDALVRVLPAGDAGDGSEPSLSSLRIPDGVRDVVRVRLEPLDAEARSLLAIGALLGREFAIATVAGVAELDRETVAAALEEAERLGIVSRSADGARRRFAHALIPETLERDLGVVERARLHRRIAEILEPMVERGGASLDEVASHHLAAVPVGSVEPAIEWAGRAAERALERLGYEDAVRYYRRAIEILDATAVHDGARRVDLLLALAEAERRVGDASSARATFARAGALARDASLPQALARAALGVGAGLGGLWDQGDGTLDPERLALVNDALAAIGPEPSALRALLLAHLAATLFWSVSPERRDSVERLGAEAVEMASRVADPAVALAVRTSVHWTSWRPDDAEGRLESAEAIVREAVAQGQHEMALRGRMYSAVHHLELGDVAAADREVERFAEMASELRQLRQLWYTHVYRGMRAYIEGRFADVERAASEGMSLGRVAVPVGARMAFGAQLTVVRREQGRAAETIEMTREIARAAPGMPVWTCALASGLVEAGDLAAARVELERLAAGGFASLPRDFLWLFAVTNLCRVSAALDDARTAEMLYDLLLPYAGRVAVAQHGILCDGAVARYLGLLATTLERWGEAIRHFESALARNEQLGAAIFVTATQHDYARMLLRRDAAGDAANARRLLDEAAARAAALGQIALQARIATIHGEPVTPRPLGEDVCTFRREKDAWRFAHADRTFALRDTVGIGHLVTLLRHPGREIHVLDLVADERVPGSAGDAGELLDESARGAYRSRLADLAVELEEARRFNDIGRTERAQAEIDSLTDELSRAVGLGGRPRRAGSVVERARLNVTRAVRRAIEAIAAHDAALGSDLERGVRTGVFCSYTPDPRLPIRWEL